MPTAIPAARHLTIRMRLRLLAGLCLLLALLPTGSLVLRYGQDLEVVRTEAAALPANRAWQQVLAGLQTHREAMGALLSSQAGAAERIKAARQTTLAAIDQLDGQLQAIGAAPARLEDAQALRAALLAQAAAFDAKRPTAAQLMAAQRELAQAAVVASARLNADAQLLLDPHAGSYFAIIAGLQAAPKVGDDLSELVTIANAAAVDDVALVASALGRYRDDVAFLTETLEQAMRADVSLVAPYKGLVDGLRVEQKRLTATVDAVLADPNFPLDTMSAAFSAAVQKQAAISAAVTGSVEAQLTARGERLERARAGLLAAIPLLIGGVLLALWFTVRGIMRPVDEVVRVTDRIAGGDLSGSIGSPRHDEMGQVLRAIGVMQQRLRGLIGQIQQGAEGLNASSDEIAQGQTDLGRRTEGAAARLQQTAAGMHELGQIVRQSAATAHQANALAAAASGAASEGGELVRRVVLTIGQIHTSATEIASIIGVIDGIAFQTNILALNAAVEAARAGEQGRGFAVVAAEVRSLAGRSAEAARQIKVLIANSVERVEQGTQLVGQAGRSMEDIVAGVASVTQMIGGIAEDADRQAQRVGDVVASVAMVDEMTQQNAALVEQSVAASHAVRGQAETMRALVGSFSL